MLGEDPGDLAEWVRTGKHSNDPRIIQQPTVLDV